LKTSSANQKACRSLPKNSKAKSSKVLIQQIKKIQECREKQKALKKQKIVHQMKNKGLVK